MSIDPTFEAALGLYRSGRLAQAESLLRDLSGRDRRFEYFNVLGAVLAGQGKLQDAAATFRQAIAIDLQSAIAAYNLGNALSALGKFDEAIEIYQRSVQLDPQSAPTWNNLGSALSSAATFDEAIEAYQRALALRADFPQAAESLGSLLRDTRCLDEAISHYDRVLSIRPEARLASARVYALLFHEDWSSSRLLAEHVNWAKQYAPQNPGMRYDNDPMPDRRLRIGYVSPDFRQHVIGCNLLPLVREHDRSQVKVF
jgi:tetratricopeptide (TPR) repeat protein